MLMTMLTTKACPNCGKVSTFALPTEAVREWETGVKPVQVAFPQLSADQREQLLTGYHGDCFDQVAKPDDEE